MNFSILRTILVTFGPETLKFTRLIMTPFAAILQKSAYHAKYLTMFWTYLDLLYRFGRRISGVIFQVFVWRSPKGRFYGNQLNMGDVRKRREGPPLLFASAFDNGLADRKSAFKRFNGNNQATSYPNFVNLCPVISEFMLLTITPFAAIQQKSAYHAKYLRISWTYLDLVYRFGKRIGGDNYPDIRLVVAQGTLLRHHQERPLLYSVFPTK